MKIKKHIQTKSEVKNTLNGKIILIIFCVFIFILYVGFSSGQQEIDGANIGEFLGVLESDNDQLDFNGGQACFYYNLRMINLDESFESHDISIYSDDGTFDFSDELITLYNEESGLNLTNSDEETLDGLIGELDLEGESSELGEYNQLTNDQILNSVVGVNESDFNFDESKNDKDEIPEEFLNQLNESLGGESFDFDKRIIHSDESSFVTRDVTISLNENNFSYFDQVILMYYSVDRDGDGFSEITCGNPNVVVTDCNDNNPLVNVGALEICDGIDNNCNGAIDELACECNDGVDNTGNLLIDVDDPGCWLNFNDQITYNPSGEENSDFECSRDADCGDTGYVSEEYCYLGNVFKDYERNICDNRGHPDSMCIEDEIPMFIEYCPNGCSVGRCIYPIENNQERQLQRMQTIPKERSTIKLSGEGVSKESDRSQGKFKFFPLLLMFLIGIILITLLVVLNGRQSSKLY